MTNPASHGRPALHRDRVPPGLLVVPHFPDRLRAANDDGRTPRINGGAGRGHHPNA